ncbi:hypothetical protein GCM10010381_59340 [Streptomyces xantholiticus]|nr:hypothetical protein GCM10010381_59340 [Streptomyces xantholiticus]
MHRWKPGRFWNRPGPACHTPVQGVRALLAQLRAGRAAATADGREHQARDIAPPSPHGGPLWPDGEGPATPVENLGRRVEGRAYPG